MLERIREGSQGITAKVILGLVILTFAVAGVGDYTSSVDTSLATVNGVKISQNDFEKSFQSQRDRMAQQYGEMFEKLSADANYMAQFRQDVLNNLINEKVIEQSSADMGLRVTDAQIKETIRSMTEFQVDGVFDNNRYLAIIQQAGFYQSSSFRDYLRTEMTRTQLSQSVVASEFALPYQAAALSALRNQTRDIKFAIIKSAQFDNSVEVTDEEIAQFYKNNIARFENPEQVKVDYITLSVADIAKNITVSQDEVKEYYQNRIAEFTQAEQRRVSHILIEFGDDEDAAKDQANDILARIKNNEDFVTLAKEFSADTFSGEKGGDLDWVKPGTMDDAFDTAAFALTLDNNVSDIVKTEFGFHIIKLTDYKPAVVETLAEVSDKIAIKISHNKAEEQYYSLLSQMTELSFEFPDTLDDAAGAINTEVKTSGWIIRGTNNSTPFNNDKVIEAAFSDLVLSEQVNSDVIEVSDGLAMVVHLNEYKEAKPKALADVTTEIKTQLTQEKAAQKALNTAEELLISYKAGNDISEQLSSYSAPFETEKAVSRYDNAVNRSITQTAFTLAHPSDGIVSANTTSLSGGDVALVEVVNVNEAESEGNENTQQLTSQLAQSAYGSFIDALVAKAKIKRRPVSAVEEIN